LIVSINTKVSNNSVEVNKVIGLDNPTEITRADVETVVRSLLNNNAYTIMDNIEGEDKFGTAPVRDAYFALTSTNLTGNLDSVAGFVQKNQYPSPMNALRKHSAQLKSSLIDLELVVAIS
jgi:hypothetical protein